MCCIAESLQNFGDLKFPVRAVTNVWEELELGFCEHCHDLSCTSYILTSDVVLLSVNLLAIRITKIENTLTFFKIGAPRAPPRVQPITLNQKTDITLFAPPVRRP